MNAQAAERPSSSGPARLGVASDGTRNAAYPGTFRALTRRVTRPAAPAAIRRSESPARMRRGSGMESALSGPSLSKPFVKSVRSGSCCAPVEPGCGDCLPWRVRPWRAASCLAVRIRSRTSVYRLAVAVQRVGRRDALVVDPLVLDLAPARGHRRSRGGSDGKCEHAKGDDEHADGGDAGWSDRSSLPARGRGHSQQSHERD